MSRFKTSPEDWKRAAEEGEKADEASGMFIAKRMKEDRKKIYIAFLEIPTFGTVQYKDGPATRGQANVASFGPDGMEFEGIFLLEMAPKHINGFLTKLERPECGLDKVYEIERRGAKNYKQTIYTIEILRPLTQPEMDSLETIDFYELFKRQGDDATPPAPATPAPAIKPATEAYIEWNRSVVVEAKRLGWDAEGKLAENVRLAIATYFGEPIEGQAMDVTQRDSFIDAMRGLADGTAPANVGNHPYIDLDEDVDFF